MTDKKVHGSGRRKLRIILIFSPIALIFILTGVGAYFYVNSITNTETIGTKSTKSPLSAKEQSIAASYKNAQEVAKTSGVKAGQAVLDKELANTTAPSDQAGIYGAKVALEDSTGTDGDLSKMITFALKADELAPTPDTASLLGSLYRRSHDKDNAIRYYTLAMERVGDVSKADLQTQGDYSYYQSSIEAIKNGS